MACNETNPLQRGGTSQQQRISDALQPGYVNIDERQYADWIDFASRFGQYLNYYDSNNTITGNWQPFFDNDISAIIGSIAIQDIDAYRREIKTRFDLLKSEEHKNNTPLLKSTLGELFGAIITLSSALDNYLFRLPDGQVLKATIQNLINQKLQPALGRILSYYKGGISNVKTAGGTDDDLIIITDNNVPGWLVLNEQVAGTAVSLQSRNLSPAWLNGQTNLATLYAAVLLDKSIYGDDLWTPYERINHAANHNLFAGLFDQYLAAYARIHNDAQAALLQSLTSYNTHQPHYTLFLTFLRLFRNAQDDLNTLTLRHLDFYYKEVLRLTPKDAQPNSVHLLMELAKNVEKQLLPKGTLFKAGKDSAGKEVSYALNADTLFSHAKVAALKSVYLGETAADNIGAVINQNRLFASQVTNSANGLGADLTTASKEWQPFAGKAFINGKVSAINMPKAEIGFAIASSYLFLTEGARSIQVSMILKKTAALPASIIAKGYLTTAKGWQEVVMNGTTEALNGQPQGAITFRCSLTGADPAIANFNPKIHTGTYQAGLPVLRVILQNEDDATYQYAAFKNVLVQQIMLSVFAGMDEDDTILDDGLKNLKLSNDFGTLDGSKPFQPFGINASKDSSLVLGNEELFKKPGANFQLRLKWTGLPANGTTVKYPHSSSGTAPNVSIELLERGSWTDIHGTEHRGGRGNKVKNSGANAIITSSLTTISDTKLVPDVPTPVYTKSSKIDDSCYVAYEDTYLPYSITSKSGFMRLSLLSSFGQDEYQKALIAYLLDKTKTNPGNDTPYLPKLQSLTLHYKAEATVDFTIDDDLQESKHRLQFLHIHPFGEKSFEAFTKTGPVNMLPQFVNGTASNIGEWYIGIQDLQPNDGVNILFQLLEGTANPLVIKPTEHVSWSYLSRNEWLPFDKLNVTDNTEQLIQSGIISFVIPANATTENTVLPTGHIWLRASVSSAVDAVCKMITVDAQACVATLIADGIAPDFMSKGLAPGTISKMKEPLAAIKKISQPYSSFEGRSAETIPHYYTRVSERLRHKNRAITIWDYERLILEAFPGLHRVKCLNHTKFDEGVYHEVAHGHVTIITIPDLTNRNDANPLRPYTNESTLTQISDFLSKRISCHVTTHVRHPLFEEVVLSFKLKLYPGYEYNYYSNLLRDEITAFLTPWAYGRTQDVAFGGKVIKSVLINFIEERSYVDYITDVKMYHDIEGQPANVNDIDVATASTGRSILVSVPAANHIIEEIKDSAAVATATTCVDNWQEYTQVATDSKTDIKLQ